MKKFLYLLFILAVSCSHHIVEPLERSTQYSVKSLSLPKTKNMGEAGDINLRKTLHKSQSNHIAILINSIHFNDSVYVQTLSPEDLKNFGITKEERLFAEEYLSALNESCKAR